MISIIIRAHNRLEYTIRCLDILSKNPPNTEYEVIAVNQASDDGTKEWLEHTIAHPKTSLHFKNIRLFNLEENLGDWGGMEFGFKQLSPKSNYVCQLDNDALVPKGAFTLMQRVIDEGYAECVMLKRRGFVQEVLNRDPHTITLDGKIISVARVGGAVTFWMVKSEHAREYKGDHPNTRVFTNRCGRGLLLMNVFSQQIDGFNLRDGVYLQHNKYPLSEKLK